MGQGDDFCGDLARMETNIDPENPEHGRLFDLYIARKDHMREIMRAFFRVAFEPLGHLQNKTKDMMIAECVWDSIRFARGLSRWSSPFHIGPEPCPKIERREE